MEGTIVSEHDYPPNQLLETSPRICLTNHNAIFTIPDAVVNFISVQVTNLQQEPKTKHFATIVCMQLTDRKAKFLLRRRRESKEEKREHGWEREGKEGLRKKVEKEIEIERGGEDTDKE